VYATKKQAPVSPIPLLSASLAALLLVGCAKPVEKMEEIRPVRVMHLTGNSVNLSSEFSGEVRPRIESRLGFQVSGKVIARKVDVGSVVKRGQVLMQLDPLDLQLAQAQASAVMRAAQSNRDLAQQEKQRFQDLRDKKFVSQSALDAKATALKSAQASYDQAEAALKGQSNQTSYTQLISDADGVVTAVDAEVGQVVAPGTPVVRVAQSGAKEVQVGLPEDQVDTLRDVSDVRVRLWAAPNQTFAGKIREISPVADPATRTYLAKISIPDAGPRVKLGMTAYVSFADKSANAPIKVPLTALYQEKGVTSVWVVQNNIVTLTPVKVAGATGNDFFLAGGVTEGQMIVTAGVNSLKPNQKVKILDQEMVPQQLGAAGGAAK
jgi:multidrug efflux system membrane fusion protein